MLQDRRLDGEETRGLFGGHWIHPNPLELPGDELTHSQVWKLKTERTMKRKSEM